jgi:hypothetical protein
LCKENEKWKYMYVCKWIISITYESFVVFEGTAISSSNKATGKQNNSITEIAEQQ